MLGTALHKSLYVGPCQTAICPNHHAPGFLCHTPVGTEHLAYAARTVASMPLTVDVSSGHSTSSAVGCGAPWKQISPAMSNSSPRRALHSSTASRHTANAPDDFPPACVRHHNPYLHRQSRSHTLGPLPCFAARCRHNQYTALGSKYEHLETHMKFVTLAVVPKIPVGSDRAGMGMLTRVL